MSFVSKKKKKCFGDNWEGRKALLYSVYQQNIVGSPDVHQLSFQTTGGQLLAGS